MILIIEMTLSLIEAAYGQYSYIKAKYLSQGSLEVSRLTEELLSRRQLLAALRGVVKDSIPVIKPIQW